MWEKPINDKKYKDDVKLQRVITEQLNRKCSCGHTITFKRCGITKIVCRNCGELVFRNAMEKFKWETKKARIQNRKGEKYLVYAWEDVSIETAYQLKIREIDYKNRIILVEA